MPGPVCKRRIKFIAEAIARAAGAVTERAAALNHEVRHDAVEYQAVVEGFHLRFGCFAGCLGIVLGALGKSDEVGDGERSFFKLELGDDFSFRRVEFRVHAVCQLFSGAGAQRASQRDEEG